MADKSDRSTRAEHTIMPREMWQGRFIHAFRDTANVRMACESAGISRDTAYRHRNSDPTFREQWDQAREDAIDTLEKTAWARAKEGSDYLLWKLLEANRRAFYGSRQTVTLEASASLMAAAERLGIDRAEMEAAVAEAE